MPTTALPPGPAKRGIGRLEKLRHGLNFMLDPMGFVGGRFARFGDTYFVGSDDQPGLFVFRHPDHLEQIFVHKAKAFEKKHSGFRMLSRVLGDGLLTTDGDVWRRQRRLLQPAFSKARMRDYADAMVAETRAEVRGWADGEERDVAESMMKMTLRIVCRTLFGHDAADEVEAVGDSMEALQGSLLSLNLPIPAWLSPAERRLRRANRTLDAIIYKMVDTRTQGEPRPDLLQRLIDARDEDGSSLGRREIRDQLVTLFLAGHETTSNALAWTFYLLGQNPEAEAKLHAELDEVLGGEPPTYEDLPRLTYTLQVFLEAMRLYPPVYLIGRLAVEDVQIGRWTVPAGSEVVMWVWHTHRDPRWFPEPWRFMPERFAPDAIKARPKGAYLPFGAGPRACIGKVFAQMEGQLALATIASQVRLRPLPGHSVELQPRITLSPAGGLPMHVERRR
ncbi:MAG TPA: cytochrome P450 [Polyangiaceae bacterium]|nr:cytochrome P450 [Polyangiaceae bacterium]